MMETFGSIVAALLTLIVLVTMTIATCKMATEYSLDPNHWICTKTVMKGKSPYQHEECTQYTEKDK